MDLVDDPIKIMIVEDIQIIRLGLKLLLEEIPNFRVVTEANEGTEALAKALEFKPDVILMDIGLPGMDGVSATAQIKGQMPDVRVIMLTSHESDDDIFAALGAGANGFCLKDVSAIQLAMAINAVHAGGTWLEPRIAERVVQSHYNNDGTKARNGPLGLTPHDLQLLRLVEQGLDDVEVARRMQISVDALRMQMRTIVETLFSSDRVKASVESVKLKMTDSEKVVAQEQPLPAELQPNEVFADRYQIIALAGEGGMGRVYKAKHTHIDRTVAIKILHPNLTADPRQLKLFQDEAKAASSLKHPNVVTIYDFGVSSGQQFLVMDFLMGQSLDKILDNVKSLDFSRFFSVFDQVLDALSAAHEKDIAHCDLKPSNIIITADDKGNETVTVVDFGLAKILPHPSAPAQMQITESFEVSGSPLYMSPEQCTGRRLDFRSDIYSVGCVMYEAITGEPVFDGFYPMEVFAKHLQQAPLPFSQICPSRPIPAQLEWLVFKALEKSPERRFKSAREMRGALQAVANMTLSGRGT
jgi:DNA-binding NarL/FixJ family response regulator/tRNA A-37 threonylcarbamoyl transferase component Bud32